MVEHQTLTLAEALLPIFVLATLALLLRLAMVHESLEQERRAHAEASRRCRLLEQEGPGPGDYLVTRGALSGSWFASRRGASRIVARATPLEALGQLIDREQQPDARRPS